MRALNIIFWASTGLFAAFMLMGGWMDLTYASAMQQGMEHLGYPEYFTRMLGVAKLLGAVALLTPGWPRLKEWAYAGFTFDLVGAIVSHLALGDAFSLWVAAPIASLLLFVSYFSYRKRQAAQNPSVALATA